jgi:hypothetical protein
MLLETIHALLAVEADTLNVCNFLSCISAAVRYCLFLQEPSSILAICVLAGNLICFLRRQVYDKTIAKMHFAWQQKQKNAQHRTSNILRTC